MVATRRGTRGGSAENTTDEATETPASTVKTRRRTGQVTTRSRSEQTGDSQQDEAEEQNTAPAKATRSPNRGTRSSKPQPADKQPESTHEADVSESESCLSEAMDIQPASRSKRRAPVREKAKTESGSSSLGETLRRSTRVQKKPVPVLESTTSQEDEHSGSCSSLSLRVTRSRRKSAVAPGDSAHSEADSCSSAVSGPQGSTVRRSTRTRTKITEPMTIRSEQSETAEASAAFEPRGTRGQRGKARSTEEDQAYDDEDCQSGPSLTPRRTTRSRVGDSDSESISTTYTSLDSPCSTRDWETPCSSRTGSASSSRAIRGSRVRNVRITLDVPTIPAVVFKSVKDRRENEPQAKTAEDIPCLSVSAINSDVEEMEEAINKKTVVAADHEWSVAEDKNDVTLTLDEDEVVKSESRQDLASETVKTVEECEDGTIADEAMETHEHLHSVQEIQTMEEESSSVSVATQESVTGTREDRLNREETSEVLCEPEEKVDAIKELINMESRQGTVKIDQGPSEEVVLGIASNKEGSSSSSEVPEASTEKLTSVKGCISLLDSSEDEESDDDDGLSVEGGNDKAEDSDSEGEMCCSDDQPGPSGAPQGNGLFVIDTRPGCQASEKYYIDSTQNEDDDVQDCEAAEDDGDFVDEEGDDDEEEDEDTKVLFSTRKQTWNEFSSSIDPGLKVKALGGLYINFDGSKSKSVSYGLKKLKDQKNQDELLKKSVIGADFEKKDTVPPYKESKHAAKLKRREERAKTTGDGWFDMRAPEVTEELKNDLKALQMRSAMDPKRFYKKNDREGFPKYFQVGTVVDNPIDFYHSRVPKKQRKRTIMEELLADAEFRSFNKKKYSEIMAEKAAAGKMNRKKHKMHKKK